jgi:hypothetical protein
MTLSRVPDTFTIGGTPNTTLQVAIPAASPPTKSMGGGMPSYQ